jgi:hypothetical protein
MNVNYSTFSGESGIIIPWDSTQSMSEDWLEEELEVFIKKIMQDFGQGRLNTLSVRFLDVNKNARTQTYGMAYFSQQKLILRKRDPHTILHEMCHLLVYNFYNDATHGFQFKYLLQNMIYTYAKYIEDFVTKIEDLVDAPKELIEWYRKEQDKKAARINN